MFIAAWFIITNIWKQPKCPLTDEWIKKLRHVYIIYTYVIYIYIYIYSIENKYLTLVFRVFLCINKLILLPHKYLCTCLQVLFWNSCYLFNLHAGLEYKALLSGKQAQCDTNALEHD